MNADDRQLIGGMFERMHNVQGLQKDADAEAFIHECMRHNPDSAYMLVQSVLVQEQALQKADARLKALEAKVTELETGNAQQSASPAAANNSFVGARSSAGFGHNNGSVPTAGQVPGQAPWQRSAHQDQQPPANRPAGGGFMAQAMTTAAGVAGGMLLASGISSLFSGGDSALASTPADATDTGATEQPAADTSQTAEPAPQEEPAVQEVSNDDGGFFGDWGGGDDSWGGGDDFEI